ncbi:hypothetical protein G3578_08130 [Brevibacillus sp. SYP-B805]|uniref:hypothetical protein n=1 Tax=Brevibacillus sp. SYP-B805 TaxID=1578199 RepID=UPI0013EAC91D|nr:hypothetical protein [Brevibacillus sp. SYP-B805]NGQ95133.1 hypothetical protein [Brevibacillus sp. SYP-B805]
MMKRTYGFLALALVTALGLAGCSSASTHEGHETSSNQEAPKQEAAADIKSGVAKMLEETAELKKQLEAGDQAKVKEAGQEVHEAWESFEDNVKAKYPDLYNKVEEALDPLVAGTEAQQLDKEAVGKLNDQLTAALNELAAKEQ